MKHTLALLLVTLLGCSLNAVEVEKLQNPALFGIRFEQDSQEFYGRADSVNSISIQTYLTASFRVSEVVIDMHGSPIQLRIYHTGALDPREEAERLHSNTGVKSVGIPTLGTPSPIKKALEGSDKLTNTYVFKEYPVTTHAKTIEYRVSSRDELVKLYSTLRDHWLRQRSEDEQSSGSNDANNTEGSSNTGQNNSEKPPRLNGRLFIVGASAS